MNLIIGILLTTFSFGNVYDFTIKDSQGKEIQLAQFKGKKILFVNTASSGKYANQFEGLEKLYNKYKESLVIIVFPSNSFGHEPGQSEINQHRNQANFIISEKSAVIGKDQTSLYSWLTDQSKNGVMNNRVQGDFFKFLVDESGNLMGAFVSSVDPMSQEMQSAIVNK